jgi:tetratricopeptide (TPR) repeat protein
MVLPVLPTLGLGVAGNILSRSMNGSSDRLIGLDFASQYALSQKLGLGLVFKNAFRMSQGDTEDKLPQKIRLGVGYQPLRGLTVSADVENFSQFYMGAEYTWSVIAFRAGVMQNNPTYGFGLHWKNLGVDFALANSQDLGASQRMSIRYAFGRLKGSDVDYNPDLSSDKFVAQGEEAIQKGFYAQAEQLFRSARHVNPKSHDIQDKLERLGLITLYVHSMAGWDRPSKMARQGLNDFLSGKNIDAIWRLTYAYSLDKGQTGLLRVTEAMGRLANYRVSLYDPSSELTLAQQVLAQALVDIRVQHYDEASTLCQRVISLESNNALAYKRLGSSLYALHQFDAAKLAWQKAMAYETDAAAKEQLKSSIEMARAAALGLPLNMPGDAADQGDEIDVENDIGQHER